MEVPVTSSSADPSSDRPVAVVDVDVGREIRSQTPTASDQVNCLCTTKMSSCHFFSQHTITEFLQAAATGDKNVLMGFLNDFGFYVNTVGDYDGSDGKVSALALAVRNGHTECVKILLDHGADLSQITQHYTRAMVLMSRQGQQASASFISLAAVGMYGTRTGSDDQVRPPYQGFVDCALRRDFQTVSLLISEFAQQISVEGMWEDTFCFLILSGCPKSIVGYALGKGEGKADVNGYNCRGFTPLISAILVGCIEMVDYLMEEGADVNKTEDLSCVEDLECRWVESLLLKSKENDDKGDENELLHYDSDSGDNNGLLRGAVLNSNGKSPLMFAAWSLNLRVVRRLLMAPDLDGSLSNSQSQTALVHAIYSGSLDVMNEFSAHGLDLNYFQNLDNKYSDVYLLHAVKAMNMDIIKSLMDAGVKKNTVDRRSGRTAVMCLAEQGNADGLEVLLSHGGFDVNVVHNYTLSAVTLAAENNHYDSLKVLIAHGVELGDETDDDETDDVPSSLEFAAEFSNDRCVELLMRTQSDRIGCGMRWIAEKIIYFAARNVDSEVLKFVMSYCDNVNDFDDLDMTPLMHAVSSGLTENMELLLDHGGDVNVRRGNGNLAILHAISCTKPDALKLLIEHGADVNSNVEEYHGPLLLHAAQLSDIQFLELLFQHGAGDVNTRSISTGHTPLIEAVQCNRLENTRLLLKHGADVNLPDDDGAVPAIHAVRVWFTDGLRELIEAGADLNAVDNCGKTVLAYALESWSCLEILLKEGSVVEYERVGDNNNTQRKLKPIHTNFDFDHRCYWDVRTFALLLDYDVFDWEWYRPAYLTKFAFAALHIENKSPVLSPQRGNSGNRRVSSLLQEAFADDNGLTLRYLFANLFFTLDDYRALVSLSDFHRGMGDLEERKDSESETVSVYRNISRQPWRLETMCFLTISSAVSSSSSTHSQHELQLSRSQRVDSLPLPSVFRSKLKFENTVAKLCPSQWAFISWQDSDFLPVLKSLCPREDDLKECGMDCLQCDGLGYVIDR